MRALRFEIYGPPSSLSIADLPTPTPGAGEVLVEIRAAGINPSDVKNVAGAFGAVLPRVPGRDYAGVIVGGDGVRGEEIWGSGAGFGVTRDGAHADYVLVPADSVSKKPGNLSMEQAATAGVPYLVAWRGLVHAAGLRAGETVLIIGASGAVGRAATQIAHDRQARVLDADRRAGNPSGVDIPIDTISSDLRQTVLATTAGKGADGVFNTVGGAMFEPAMLCLRQGGRHIVIASVGERRVSFDLIDFYHNQARLVGVDSMKFTAQAIAAIMDELRPRFEAGRFTAPDIRSWPLEQGIAAYQAVERGGAPVRHVLRMR